MIDAEIAAAIWNDCYPERFRIDGETIRRHLGQESSESMEGALVHWKSHRDLHPSLAPVFGPLVVLKRSGVPRLFAGQTAHVGHVALWITDLVWSRDALDCHRDWAKANGITRLVYGMDPDHLLPGVPENMPFLTNELLAYGFEETGRCFDLERDLIDYELPEECLRALADNGAEVRACCIEDIDALDGYLARVFPGRWRHDVMRKVRIDQEPEQVYLLLMEGEIVGHAMTQSAGCKRPVAGAVWHLSLGESWGALGSIGIDPIIRGRGLGNALLGLSLWGLRERGARQTIIDWTTLGDFYGAHGFKVTRRYTQLGMDLP